MFGNMVFQTYLVGAGAASLREAIKLFWTFRVPWGWTYTAGIVADWVAQFSFGFYSLMLTSLLLGLIVMVLYKPRTWCTFVGWDMLNATGKIAVIGFDGGAEFFDLLFCPAGVCNNFHVKAFLHTD